MKKSKKLVVVTCLKKMALMVLTGVMCISSIMPVYADEVTTDEAIPVEAEVGVEEAVAEDMNKSVIDTILNETLGTDVKEAETQEIEDLNVAIEVETESIMETEAISDDSNNSSEAEEEIPEEADQIELFSMGFDSDINGNLFGMATETGDDGALLIAGTGSMEDVFGPYKQQLGNWLWQNLQTWRYYKITLLDGLTSIGAYAFEGFDGLAKIVIPDTVTRISDGAFKNCKSLHRIEIPESVVTFGKNIFEGTPIEEIYVVSGSAAHKYCQENALPFIALTKNVESATHMCNGDKPVTKKATLTKDGYSGNKCSECDFVGFHSTIYHPSVFSLSKTAYVYDGKVKSPKLTIKDRHGNIISSEYYDVVKSAGRKNPGTYSYTIKFKGNYSGTKTVYYDILPVAPKKPVVSSAKGVVTVGLAKQSCPITGYQIQYSTSKDFKTNCKTISVFDTKATSKTISNLSKGKKYYVRVRTFKLTDKTYLRSGWSSYTAVTVK